MNSKLFLPIYATLITLFIQFVYSQNLTSKSLKSFESVKYKVKKNTKESAPYYSFAAWDHRGKICLLVKLDAMFTITYEADYGKQQLIHRLPIDSEMKGRCSNVLDANSVMDITWKGGFMFRIVFEKYRDTETWSVKSMNFVYNTGDSIFDGVIEGKEKVARIKDEKILLQFETPLGKSYLCPSPDVLNLYDSVTDEPTVILRLSNVQIQAFDITAGKFSPVLRCGQVGFGSGVPSPFGMQPGESDGVQMTIFTITIMSSISTVLGYALYRSWFVKKIDYDNAI